VSETNGARVVDVAVYGLVNAGKSSLINALAGRPICEVGPTAGTTTEVAREPWAEVETSAGLFTVRLLDTPGLEEVGDEARGKIARVTARRAQIVVFVTEEDLTASALDAVRRLHAWGKPLIVAWNKVDQFGDADRAEILEALRGRLADLVPPDAIVPVAAAPLIRTRVESASGGSRVELVRGEPEIGLLRARMAEVIAGAEGLIELAKASDDVESLVTARATKIVELRERAERVADETSLGLSLALAVNPVPLIDLITAPAGIAILVRRIAGVYEVPLDAAAVKSLSSDLIRGGRIVMWGTLLGTGAGGLLKFIPGLGHLAGAVAEGASAGLFGHVLSRALIEYFERGGDWGESGLIATLDRIASTTDQRAVTQGLVDELKKRLGEQQPRIDRTKARLLGWLPRSLGGSRHQPPTEG
jgi:GTPase